MTQQELPLGLTGLSILVSILLHGLLFWLGSVGFQKTTPHQVDQSLKNKPVQWIDLQKDLKPKRLVESIDQSSITDQNVQSDLISDQNRKVKQQTVGPSSTATTSQPRPTQSSGSSSLNLSEGDLSKILEDTQKTPYTISFNPNNYLPDIQVGEQTMLSTQKFAYATYFIRMKQAIQVYWKPPSSLIAHNPHKKAWISQMLIILNEHGELIDQQITDSSGLEALDQHALMAVWKAAPFYNPPEVLLDDVGEIRMTWHFIFEHSRF